MLQIGAKLGEKHEISRMELERSDVAQMVPIGGGGGDKWAVLHLCRLSRAPLRVT